VQVFAGRFEYTMDDRGRVPVPPRYRNAFAEEAWLNEGPDSCLRLFTAESFQREADLYTSKPSTEREGREDRRDFFANCMSVELDRQGRILIPGPMRSAAGLENAVIVAGTGEWLEIWEPRRFADAMAKRRGAQAPAARRARRS
jgi:MraZ protein